MSDFSVHINNAPVVKQVVETSHCPTCDSLRKMLLQISGRYDMVHRHVCLACGETWHDGERMERPFAPRWRKQNVEQAKKALADHGRFDRLSEFIDQWSKEKTNDN